MQCFEDEKMLDKGSAVSVELAGGQMPILFFQVLWAALQMGVGT